MLIARVLMPGDAFRNMSGPVSWAVSVGLGLAGALVGYVIFTLGLGIGDTDIFDWGGLFWGPHRHRHRGRAGQATPCAAANHAPCRPPARRRPRHPRRRR